MAEIDQETLIQLHAGLEVVKTQQSEINRRLTRIEGKVEANMVAPRRVVALEEWREKEETPTEWGLYVYQAMLWAVGITVVGAIGKLFGVEVAW